MAKKRPRASRSKSNGGGAVRTKLDPAYWLRRLFRNTFTYRGERIQVAHWSVKIQHSSTRKTLSLKSKGRDEAAVEACALYKSIVAEGWQNIVNGAKSSEQPFRSPAFRGSTRAGLNPGYWLPRLVQRKYTDAFQTKPGNELSARIEHEGTSFYFPLRTSDRKMAASRAAEIYKAVRAEGWEKANERFSRELSVAFHWADDPVAWTYTTIQTRVGREVRRAFVGSSRSDRRLQAAIAEPDEGVRQSLCWCLDQQPSCLCVAAFATIAEALREVPRRPVDLLLLSSSIVDQGHLVFAQDLKKLAPKVPTLRFSTYEDSEQLFKSAPGGARGYLFRRTAPISLLDPITTVSEKPQPGRDEIAASVRRYFEQAAAALPFGQPSQQHGNLTAREHEIMGLLGKGHPDKEIADLLGISTWTVHGHLKKIFEKLGAHNRTDAVVKYLHK